MSLPCPTLNGHPSCLIVGSNHFGDFLWTLPRSNFPHSPQSLPHLLTAMILLSWTASWPLLSCWNQYWQSIVVGLLTKHSTGQMSWMVGVTQSCPPATNLLLLLAKVPGPSHQRSLCALTGWSGFPFCKTPHTCPPCTFSPLGPWLTDSHQTDFVPFNPSSSTCISMRSWKLLEDVLPQLPASLLVILLLFSLRCHFPFTFWS